MAADDYDETTGAPQFAGAGAPDTGVDLTLIAAFAASVGNYLGGLTTAQRTAYEYVRESLLCWDTDEDTLYMHNGAGWQVFFHDWKSYTPVATNITGGTLAAKYRRLGSTVEAVIRHTLTGAGISAQPSYSLPVAAVDADIHNAGSAFFRDASASTEIGGFVRLTGGNSAAPFGWVASTPYQQFVNVSPTIPFTWAVDDFLEMRFAYEV